MEKCYLVHEDDCEIVRPDSKWDIAIPGKVVLVDSEGDRVLVFPESWTDQQVRTCLRIANKFYVKGHNHGMNNKSVQIRKVLGIGD